MQSDRRHSIASRTFTVTADVEESADSAETSPCIVESSQPPVREGDECDITTFVQTIVAGASVIERRGQELHYRLPLLHARPRTLARLFSQLDEQKERLGVVSYGMSSCTMEEVQSTVKALCTVIHTCYCTTLYTDLHEIDRTGTYGEH